nr:hypothetical protein [Tanacetum cinerariifolium]
MIDDKRLIIHIDFGSKFEIARSTKSYKAVLQTLPQIFVGKPDPSPRDHQHRFRCSETKIEEETNAFANRYNRHGLEQRERNAEAQVSEITVVRVPATINNIRIAIKKLKSVVNIIMFYWKHVEITMWEYIAKQFDIEVARSTTKFMQVANENWAVAIHSNI